MTEIQKLLKSAITYIFTVCLLIMLFLTGCLANYGKLKRDSEIARAFQNNQVRSDYKYYYYGFDTRPYAMIGVDPKYEAGTRIWREVQPNTEQFKEMTRWIWEDYGYYTFGAHILDPNGNKVGIYYSSIWEVAVKFFEENRIMVMPHTPYLWGPDANSNSVYEHYSQNFTGMY